MIGRVLRDEFRIDAELGAGGMSRVYLAHQLSVDRKVVVKVMTPPPQRAEQWRARFMQEARVASKVRHPGIVTIYSFGEEPGIGPYIAMEYVEGRSLREHLHASRRLSPARACSLMAQVCRAMHVAHDAGVVHRDLKPDNIMVEVRDDREFARVLDFGIAKPSDSLVNTLDEHVVGTPDYMAPEQARKRPIDARTDVYAAGIILFELCAGERPFSAPDALTLMFKHVSEELPVGRLEADLPQGLVEVLVRACAKEPDGRYADAREMALALEGVVDGMVSGEAAVTTPEPEVAEEAPAVEDHVPETLVDLPPSQMRTPVLVPALFAVVVVVSVGALAWWLPRPSPHLPAVDPPPVSAAPVAPPAAESEPAKVGPDVVLSARWSVYEAAAKASGVAESVVPADPRPVERRLRPPADDDFHRVDLPEPKRPDVLSPF